MQRTFAEVGAPSIVVLVLVAMPAAARAGSSGAGETDDLRSRGAAYALRAAVHYRRAREIWRDAREQLRPLDAESAERIRIGCAALSALLLDAPSYAREVGRDEAPVAPSPLAVPDAGSIADDDLERVARVLAKAARLPGSVDRAERILVFEAGALIARMRGDAEQTSADAAFRSALDIAERGAADALLPIAVDLRFRLRDFDGALRIAFDRGDLIVPHDTCEPLARLRDAAVFAGRPADRAKIEAVMSARCAKEVEIPRPPNAVGRVLVGSRADLAAVSRVFATMASLYRLGDRERVLSAYFAAVAALEIGEGAFAAETLETALRDSNAVIGSRLRALALGQLAFAKDLLGDYESALETLGMALDAAHADASVALVARLTLNRGRVELALGQRDAALRSAREVLISSESDPQLRLGARTLAGSCWFASADEDPGALENAKRAYEAASRELGREDVRAAVGVELRLQIDVHAANVLRAEANRSADAASRARLRAEAIAVESRAMREAYDAGMFDLAAVASANLGELHIESGDLEKAASHLAWAMERARELEQFETLWRCHWYLARLADARGDSPTVDRELANAIALIESYRERILGAETKAGYMSDKMDVWRFAVDREIARGDIVRAIELAERGRARSLVDSLGWRFVSLASSAHSELYRSYVRLATRTHRARRGGAERFFGVDGRAVAYGELRDQLAALRSRFGDSERLGATLRALVDGAPATTAEIRALIGKSVTLIEYFDVGPSLVAFIVTDDSARAIRLPIAHREARLLVGSFTADHARDAATAAKLYEKLIAPIRAAVRDTRVIIVPYGALHALPFDALRSSDGYLIEHWEATYLPSASVLKFLDWNERSARGGVAPRLLAFADPSTDYDGDGKPDKVALAGARVEVAALAESFDERAVFVGSDARESLLRSTDRRCDVMHIACHGEFYPAEPWNSTLFLASESAEPRADGRLRAYEVYGLDLRGMRLVALSGCETGVSQVAGGDDPSGLATAFLHSGASSLLVSLWRVEDRATAELMKAFYRHWIDAKMSRSAALRAAKLELLHGGFDQPRQWAPFVLLARE